MKTSQAVFPSYYSRFMLVSPIISAIILSLFLSFNANAAESGPKKGRFYFKPRTNTAKPYTAYILCIWGDRDKNPSNVSTVKKSEEQITAFFKEAIADSEKAQAEGKVAPQIIIEHLYGSKLNRQQILDRCQAVSDQAGSNDVVMIYLLCHGGHFEENGTYTHFFLPTATGVERGVGWQDSDIIYRKDLLDRLGEDRHRLDILITDTCSHVTSKKSVGSQARSAFKRKPTHSAFDSIFGQFVGRININSSSQSGGAHQKGETAIGSADYGTVFSNALVSAFEGESDPTRYTKKDFLKELQTETNVNYRELKDSFKKNGDPLYIYIEDQSTQQITEYDDQGQTVTD